VNYKVKFASLSLLLIALFLVIGSTVQARTITVEPAAPASSKEELVEAKVISEAEQEAALNFWTREAIAMAEPLAMPIQAGPASLDESLLGEPDGEPFYVAASAAAPDADLIAQAAYPLDWAALQETNLNEPEPLSPDGTSQIYTAYSVNNTAAVQTLYPHKWVGRVSFQTPSGTSYCSATAISGNVMLTAAHCLRDTVSSTNPWYSNWVFTPAYRYGSSAPYGTFPATTCYVLTAWTNLTGPYGINTHARHDVGVCKMGTNSAGQTLNGAVGSMGRIVNANIKHWHNLGYPFRDYNDVLLTNSGRYLRTCVAEGFVQTTETRGMGCSYGRGISGGPWMINYALNAVSGNAGSVNSGLFIGTQNLYGARFNSSNIVPLCTAAGC
jgi:V8-like Glu-specific endopeptidase